MRGSRRGRERGLPRSNIHRDKPSVHRVRGLRRLRVLRVKVERGRRRLLRGHSVPRKAGIVRMAISDIRCRIHVILILHLRLLRLLLRWLLWGVGAKERERHQQQGSFFLSLSFFFFFFFCLFQGSEEPHQITNLLLHACKGLIEDLALIEAFDSFPVADVFIAEENLRVLSPHTADTKETIPFFTVFLNRAIKSCIRNLVSREQIKQLALEVGVKRMKE